MLAVALTGKPTEPLCMLRGKRSGQIYATNPKRRGQVTQPDLLRLLLKVGQLLAGVLQRMKPGRRREQRHGRVRVPLRDVPDVPVPATVPGLLTRPCEDKAPRQSSARASAHSCTSCARRVRRLKIADIGTQGRLTCLLSRCRRCCCWMCIGPRPLRSKKTTDVRAMSTGMQRPAVCPITQAACRCTCVSTTCRDINVSYQATVSMRADLLIVLLVPCMVHALPHPPVTHPPRRRLRVHGSLRRSLWHLRRAENRCVTVQWLAGT